MLYCSSVPVYLCAIGVLTIRRGVKETRQRQPVNGLERLEFGFKVFEWRANCRITSPCAQADHLDGYQGESQSTNDP